MRKTGARGHTRKHTGASKHAGHHLKHHPVHHHKGATAHGHNVHTKAKHSSHAKGRGYAIGDLLPVCSVEAVAMSLRLAGQRVSDDDVAELWWLAGAREVSIAEALEAVGRFGLAGYDLCSWNYLPAGEREFGVLGTDGLDVTSFAVEAQAFPPVEREAVLHRPVGQAANNSPHALILGVDLPGPHTVLATPDGWWSWGELYSPWAARIEEAWLIRWGDAA